MPLTTCNVMPWVITDRYIRGDISRQRCVDTLTAMRADPLRWFCPNRAQRKYLSAIGSAVENRSAPQKIVLCTFGNRAGKTEATIQFMLNVGLGPQSGHFDQWYVRTWPYPKTMWYCSTPDALEDVIIPRVNDILSTKPGKFEIEKPGKRIHRIVFKDTRRDLIFKSFDQDNTAFESGTVGLLAGDEPMSRRKYNACKGRLTMGGLMVLPMTPLEVEPYVVNEIDRMSLDGVQGYSHVTASMWDAVRSVGGHLRDSYVAHYEKIQNQDEVDARVYGKFVYFSGAVYPMMSRERHLVDILDWWPPPPGSTWMMTVDPHTGRMPTMIWAYRTPYGRYVIVDEFPLDKSRPLWELKFIDSLDHYADAVGEIERRWGIVNPIRIMDRHGGWKRESTTSTYNRDFTMALNRIGLKGRFLKSYAHPNLHEEVGAGIQRVSELLKFDMFDGMPGLLISDDCKHVWRGMTQHRRRTSLSSDKVFSEERFVELEKDFPDNVRALVCHGVWPTGDQRETQDSVPARKATYDIAAKLAGRTR